jgi:hypothetical protein
VGHSGGFLGLVRTCIANNPILFPACLFAVDAEEGGEPVGEGGGEPDEGLPRGE